MTPSTYLSLTAVAWLACGAVDTGSPFRHGLKWW